MKTKDFIKMLQDVDPSGEANISMEGGVPVFASLLPGYYDGSYSYLDEEGNYVTSKNDSKLCIHCKSSYDFIDDEYEVGMSWEEIREKFRFENISDEYIESFLSRVKIQFREIEEMETNIYNDSLDEMIEKAKSGWEWYQDKKVDLHYGEDINMHMYYTWKIYDEHGNIQGSCISNTESIQKSGLWEKLDNNKLKGYYQWVFN